MTETKQDQAATDSDKMAAVIENHKKLAAQAIQTHFASHPEFVCIASMVDGKMAVNVTPTTDIRNLTFSKEMLMRYIDESFDNWMIDQRKKAVEAAQEPVSGAV